MLMRARLDSDQPPSLGPISLDGAIAHRIAVQAGFDLQYLHWCPPYNYQTVEVSERGPRIEPTYGCVVWDTESEFHTVAARLGSERGALIPNAVLHVGMLGAAVTAVVVFATPRRRRSQPWGLWMALWLGLAVIAAMVGAFVAATPTVLAIEPSSGGAGA